MGEILVDDGLGVGVDGRAQHLLDLAGGKGLALLTKVPLDLLYTELPLSLGVQGLEAKISSVFHLAESNPYSRPVFVCISLIFGCI